VLSSLVDLKKEGRFGRMAEEKKEVRRGGDKEAEQEKKRVTPEEGKEVAPGKKEAVPREGKGAAEEKKETPPEAAKKMVVEEKKEEAPSGPKKKKVRELTLEEVEEKLKSVAATMGGTSSKYAQHLLQRREELLGKEKTEEK